MSLVFWSFVVLDVVAIGIGALLGLAAAGPSRTQPLVALIWPCFLPALILAGAIRLFLAPPFQGARVVALGIAALPMLLVIGSRLAVEWKLASFRDESGAVREFRSNALRDVEDAVLRGDAAAVTAASRGVDLDTQGLSGATVLVLALRELRKTPDRLEVTRALLEAGADPNVVGSELPLQIAIGASRTSGLEPLRMLLAAGADPNARTESGDPGFFIAGGAEIDVEVLQLLLAHGADVRLLGADGRSAVVLPAITRNWKVLRLLLEQGAPWRDQPGIVGVSWREHVESEALHQRSEDLDRVIAFLRAADARAPR